MASKIYKIACPRIELNLHITLQCGQSFRWQNVDSASGKWRGVLGGKVWTVTHDSSYLLCQSHPHTPVPVPQPSLPKHASRKTKCNESVILSNLGSECINEENVNALFRDYFQLDVCLENLYKSWAEADKNFAMTCPQFPGVRMLNQDPVENVFSFICSSNNNIPRITLLVERLCKLYGHPLTTVDDTTWFSFPKVAALAQPGVEDTLRAQGFGYRAKFIHKSAQLIQENGGDAWLHSLRSLPYDECRSQLMTLHGIGAKVSDCICLMSMGHLGAIPVDTHVFQIAARDYLPHLITYKTVTNKVYHQIGNHFREIFGEYAGWAHSVLFSADLKKFDELKSEDQLKNQKPKKKQKKC